MSKRNGEGTRLISQTLPRHVEKRHAHQHRTIGPPAAHQLRIFCLFFDCLSEGRWGWVGGGPLEPNLPNAENRQGFKLCRGLAGEPTEHICTYFEPSVTEKNRHEVEGDRYVLVKALLCSGECLGMPSV
jgi:hypothetical protein